MALVPKKRLLKPMILRKSENPWEKTHQTMELPCKWSCFLDFFLEMLQMSNAMFDSHRLVVNQFRESSNHRDGDSDFC
jgi:hypothetical protein